MTFRTLPLALAVLSILAALLAGPAAARGAQAEGRLFVLGFDGADARTTERLMDAGLLPNLARLRESGTYAPLGTTMPAESPVSWAALNCGQNPAKTGVPGFVKRDLASDGTPMPGLGHVRYESRPSASFETPFLVRTILSWNPWALAAAVGGGAALLFLVVFAALLRLRARISVPLALVLGAVGAAGARVAADHVPHSIATVVANPTRTAPFWEVAAQAGVRSVVIDSAMSWDRPEVPGARVLSGLGVPDVRSNNGDWFVYTTDPKVIERAPVGQSTSTAGRIFRVDERDGRIESWVYGPYDFVAIDSAEREIATIDVRLGKPGQSSSEVEALRKRRRELQTEVLPRLKVLDAYRRTDEGRVSLPLVVDFQADGAHVAIGQQVQVLQEGQWSDWYRLTFELSPLVKVRAITRAKLVKRADPFELFVDFLQFDPAHPTWWQPVSQPPQFAAELARATGEPYETVGWACLTMPFKDREIDPVTFLEDIEATQRARELLLRAAVKQADWRALLFVESTPDRVQHMMYQYADPTHPAHDAHKAAQRTRFFGEEIALSDAIRASYQSMDRVVGEVLTQHMRPGDTLLVCADHGFQSFKRQAHLNNWLAEQGYLALMPGTTPALGRALAYVDWSRTRAYAVGLGGIYLNLAGREGEGVVDPRDAPALLAELRAKLLATEDPQGGGRAVRAAYVTSEIHAGPHLGEEPDLIVGFEAGWRVSWATTLGDIRLVETSTPGLFAPASVFEDNLLNWSGDHVSVAEDLVRGIFFSNRKVVVPEGGVNLLHLAPTALALLGVAVPAEYDLAPLAFRD
ncbi:MAG: alkaline phosphatase family protein [Planctomycetes bacterium]|nr:alkaline phosphatase family protein [Planctomycetota bacterium]